MATKSPAKPRRARPPSEPAGAATRTRLLDAAEQLFAAHGFSGVSLRQIVTKADVNVAAAHYHFGSKQALFEQVFERAALPVKEETKAMLGAVDAQADSSSILEDVIRALLVPSLEASRGSQKKSNGGKYGLLRAHLFLERSTFANALFKKFYADIFEESARILQAALPKLSDTELAWRYHVLIATLVFTSVPAGRVHPLANEEYSPEDPKKSIEFLVPLLVSVFNAPVVKRPNSSRRAKKSVSI